MLPGVVARIANIDRSHLPGLECLAYLYLSCFMRSVTVVIWFVGGYIRTQPKLLLSLPSPNLFHIVLDLFSCTFSSVYALVVHRSE